MQHDHRFSLPRRRRAIDAVVAAGRMPFYATALSPAQVDAMLQRMLPQLDAAWYNHAAWFFGSPREEIPRNCGYSVGFSLVGNYLTRNGLTASGAVEVPAAAFFD